MRNVLLTLLLLSCLPGCAARASSRIFVPATDPAIQYFGRWDMSDSLHARYSWPGVFLYAEFSGTSLGIRVADGTNYFNVFIDGALRKFFHGTSPRETDYVLIDGLEEGHHTVLLGRRNITFDEVYSFSGFLLDSGATLLPAPPKPARKIEFIGDSFTAAESNEATEEELPWEARFPVTNIDKGFASFIAQHFKAQYMTTCRSGSGMVCDWKGNMRESIPARYDRTLMDTSLPKWDFKQWIPNVVVICLGLNDLTGLREKDGTVSTENSALFRQTYHSFISTIRGVYPGVKIVAVAAFPEWIRKNVKQVIDEERSAGHKDIFYTQFDEFPGGYVANGHPTVVTHRMMANQIIEAMQSFNLFPAAKGEASKP